MVRNKGFILLDPVEDKAILGLFNDLRNNLFAEYKYEIPKEWRNISKKIGKKCSHLINQDPPLLKPISTSRPHHIGFLIRPENVDIEIVPFIGKKKKVIFTRKIF